MIGKEVNRFVFYDKSTGRRTRTTVTQDEDGCFHIYNEVKIDHIVTNFNDIHGAMPRDAYIAWLSNALFNRSFLSANEDDRRWMMENS